MNQITDGPNAYDFGLDFNYAVWPKGTVVTLVNVPWNNDYRDIVKFETRSKLNEYIDSIQGSGIRIDSMSYAKPNMPIRINVPFNRAYQYNYLRASNPIQPVPGNDFVKDFYYFITDVRYIAPNTTEIVVQLDIWQTFGFDVKFGNCYIERGHIGIANSKSFDNYGRDYLTIPEGMDVGSEYQVRTVSNDLIMSTNAGPSEVDRGMDVLVVSTVNLTAPTGTTSDPNLVSADGGEFELLPTGATLWVFKNKADFSAFMANMSAYPWVTQGIISVTLIPKLTRYKKDFSYAPSPLPTKLDQQYQGGYSRPSKMFNNWRGSIMSAAKISSRYAALKKFMTFPYMIIEMTTWAGTPIVLKPESWNDPDATIVEMSALTPPNQKIAIKPSLYNSLKVNSDITNYSSDDEGEHLDLTTLISEFPTIPIVNNGQLLYLASNAHSIAYQYQSADWSQQRALGSNQASYDVQSGAMEQTRQLTNIGIMADASQTDIQNTRASQQALVSGLGNIAGGAFGGGVGGAGGGGAGAGIGALTGAASAGLSAVANSINTGIGITANSQSFATRNAAALQQLQANQGQMGLARDTNKGLADWAARGDYANSIAGINAKVQDAKLIQPTVSGQAGGQAFNLANRTVMVSLRWKTIDNAAISRIGEYWLRYGYAIQKFSKMPDTLMVMKNFTYWKLSETYITGANMPEAFKQTIRGIFEKGVTVWAAPNLIGTIDIADNEPLPNIVL